MANHEAGHATVACALGHHGIAYIHDGGGAVETFRERDEQTDLLIKVAGPMGERFPRYRNQESFAEFSHIRLLAGWTGASPSDLAGLPDDPWELISEAAAILMANRPFYKRIVSQLLTHGCVRFDSRGRLAGIDNDFQLERPAA